MDKIKRMSLDGALVPPYDKKLRFKISTPPKGRKVVYNPINVAKEVIAKVEGFFSIGDILTVEEIFALSSRSYVTLKEYPDTRFNTILFQDLDYYNEHFNNLL